MRSGILIVGIILLVFGALFYLVPRQTAGATTTTIGDGEQDTRVSYASVDIPWYLSLALMILGLILFLIGVLAKEPGTERMTTPEVTRVVETREHIHSHDGGGHKISHEGHRHRTKSA